MNASANIRSKIPYGAIKRVAEAANTSYSTVNRVIDGKSNNIKVLKALQAEIKKAERNENKIKDLHAALIA